MGLPPVVVGLVVYLLLSRAGPLGELGHPVHADGDGDRADDPDHADHRRAVAPGRSRMPGRNTASSCARSARRSSAPRATLLWDVRFSLVTIVLAGFGRAAAEVGRGDDRRRQHRRRHARDDDRDRARNQQGRSAARARSRPHPARASCSRSTPPRTSSRKRRSGATDDAERHARAAALLPLRLDDVVFAVGGRRIIDGVSLTHRARARAR